MTSKSKRMLTAILAVVMLFTTLIPMSAFAADVTMDLSKAKVSWDFTLTDAEGNTFTAAYGLKAEDNPYGYAMTPSAKKMHDYTAKAPGLSGSKSDWEYGKDYVYAFCIEHGIPLPDSDNYSASSDPTHGNKYEMLSAEQKNLLSLALAYGYPNRTDLEDSKDANACYSATQLIIWQISFGFRTSATQLNDKTYPMDGYTGTMTEQYTANKYLKDFYDRILSDMATHYTRPSFAAGVPASAKNYEMEYSNGKYSVTLTDTNHVLSKYRVTSNGGVSVSVSGNTLTISSSQPLTDAVTIKLNRRMPATTHTTGFLIWSVAGKENNNQDMVSGVPADNDPVPSYLKVSTAAGSVKIVKESEDGVVDGIRFNVTGNGVDQTVTTKNGGVIQIDNLRPGTYTVTELTENRYEPQAPKTVTVVSGQTASVLFSNTLKRGDLKIVKTAEDGKVSGVPFTVTGNGVNENVITNSKGEILIEGLLPGTYTVTEHNENYYEPQEVRTVTVVYDEVATVTFSNVLKRGDLTVNKIAEDGLHEGSKFRLYGTADCGLAVNEYAVVDSTGKAYFRDVLIGSGYVLEEVDTAVRYVIPDALTVNIEWNKVTETSVDNILKKWRAEVMKVDRDLYYGNEPGYGGEEPMLLSLKSDAIVEQYGYPYGVAQGDATLAGHTYGVFDGDRLVDTYVTDENGYFITDYYPCGDNWNIYEISVAEDGGYLLDDTVYWLDVGADNYDVELNTEYLDVLEYVIIGKISLIKHADDGSTKLETPEVGAEFEVYLKSSGSYDAAKESERDYLSCNENGYAETKWLPYGTYVVHQVSGKEGCELLPDFEVFICEEGRTYRYLANNAIFESRVKIVKTDAESGNIIPYAGAGFQIYNADGELIKMTYTYPQVTVVDIFFTNSEGYLITPEPLEYGTGYYLIEVFAPSSYVLDPTPIYFDVVPKDMTEDNGVGVIEVVRPNMPQKGTITVTKTGEVFSSVTETDGVYQPVYEVKGLAGAVYEITATEDIYSGGVLRYAQGEVVATITTGTDGTATTEPLYLGRFHIRELTAPYGMTLNGQPVSVELVYAGQEIEITSTSASFVNDRQRAEIDLNKLMEQDERYAIGMNGEILSVQFGLFASEDITAADGSVIPKDGLIETVFCDENGKAAFVTDLPVGAKLYVKELATDNRYLLSDNAYPVTFEYAGQDTAVVKITVNDGNAITNEIIRGDIIGKKLDEDGFAICGALFGLFRESETVFTEDTALLTCESNEIGVFFFEDVPFGRWIVREIKAAPAFVLNENNYAVTVSEHEEVIDIVIENEFITGSVQLTKVDKEYPDNKLAGAIFEVYVDVDGDRVFNAEVDKFVGEMTEVETGVYRMDDLRYNGYFCYEKTAPEGFLKDENYHYFEIRNDGETVTVENEAGVGFVNQPITGELELTKKDISDGKLLANVGFRIRNEVGEIVAEGYTDENGIAKFTLRYGKYTYQEFDGLDGYIIDENEYAFEIKENGEIVKAEMTNEKIPQPDNPQTGDNSRLGLWVGLAAASLGALIVLAFGTKKKRTKTK